MSAKQLIQDPAHRSWPGVREYPLNILRETILLGVIAVVALTAPIVGVLKSGWFVGYLLGIPLWIIVIPIGWFIRPSFFKSLRLTDKGIELLRRGKDVFNVPWSSIEGARVCYVGVGGVLRLYGEGLKVLGDVPLQMLGVGRTVTQETLSDIQRHLPAEVQIEWDSFPKATPFGDTMLGLMLVSFGLPMILVSTGSHLFDIHFGLLPDETIMRDTKLAFSAGGIIFIFKGLKSLYKAIARNRVNSP